MIGNSGNGTALRVFKILSIGALIVLVGTGFMMGGEEKEANLTFDLPSGKVLKYKSSRMVEQNFMGMNITFNESSEVEMSLIEKLEDGSCEVSLAYNEMKASIMRDDELDESEPQVNLKGKTVRANVSPMGKVLKVEAGGYIPGLRRIEDLEEIIDTWFIDLPDTLVKVGGNWKREVAEQGQNPEDEGPEIEGTVVYTLKKIEKKKGIEVAVVEGKAEFEIYRILPIGVLEAKAEGKIKAYLALEGGYLVESKQEVEVKGKIVGEDPATGKEREEDTAVMQYFECKLEN